MTDLDQFLATASTITEDDSAELLGWEPVTCDFPSHEAEQIHREFQQLSQGPRPVKLVRGTNGRFTIWERQPEADRWPVKEFLSLKSRTRKQPKP
jgi:hypothetical protein